MEYINSVHSFHQIPLMLESIGRKLIHWRNDSNANKIYSENNLKTEADLRAHLLICNKLNDLFPGVKIISEEDFSHPNKRPNAYWIIDPIDGTGSWLNGFDGFVTQLAYIENNIPLFGAIHAPVLKKTWSAIRGEGAYSNGKLLPKLEKNNRLILIDNTKTPHGITKKMKTLLPVTGYIECGSLGLKSVLVADGSADLFVKDVTIRDWDLAPAVVILNEVGGFLVQATGEPYIFSGSFEKQNGLIVARDSELMNLAINVFHH